METGSNLYISLISMNTDQFMDVRVKQRKSDEELTQEVKGIVGVTQRQIARVTGIHQSIIFRCKRGKQNERPVAFLYTGLVSMPKSTTITRNSFLT